jgi:hypothetical protein
MEVTSASVAAPIYGWSGFYIGGDSGVATNRCRPAPLRENPETVTMTTLDRLVHSSVISMLLRLAENSKRILRPFVMSKYAASAFPIAAHAASLAPPYRA